MTNRTNAERHSSQAERTWLTLDQVVDMVQITERHVRRLVAERRVPYTKVGGRLRFNQAEILAWLDRNSHRPDDGDHGNAA